MNVMLMWMLVGVFVMLGTQHVLIFARRSSAVEYVWIGAMSLATAGATLGYVVSHEVSASEPLMAQYLPPISAAIWLVSATWFCVEYASGDRKRRRIALLATCLIAIGCARDLGLAAAGSLSFQASASGLWRLPSLAALAIMFWLVIDGGLRLWSSGRRLRAAALAGLGMVLSVVAVQVAVQGREFPELPPSALYGFLIVAMLMTYELAGRMVDGRLTSQRQQRELAHASRLSIVGELTASIAHEINQPLGAILNNADAAELLLERPDPSLDEIRQILADIRRDGLRASDVIRHVRKLVRKRELELERLEANAVATEVIALLEPEARQRRILVASSLSPQPVWLRGDRALLEQALINLTMNAMDAVETMGAADNAISPLPPIVLAVSTTSHGEIEFQLVDAGPGVPAERLGHLFDSFYTSKPHGMGLGLSISRSIVEAHGGSIRAENNRDAGATFRITLPPCDELDG